MLHSQQIFSHVYTSHLTLHTILQLILESEVFRCCAQLSSEFVTCHCNAMLLNTISTFNTSVVCVEMLYSTELPLRVHIIFPTPYYSMYLTTVNTLNTSIVLFKCCAQLSTELPTCLHNTFLSLHSILQLLQVKLHFT